MVDLALQPIKCKRIELHLEDEKETKNLAGYAYLYQANSPLKRFFSYVIALNWNNEKERFCRYQLFQNSDFREAESVLENIASRITLRWNPEKKVYEIPN